MRLHYSVSKPAIQLINTTSSLLHHSTEYNLITPPILADTYTICRCHINCSHTNFIAVTNVYYVAAGVTMVSTKCPFSSCDLQHLFTTDRTPSSLIGNYCETTVVFKTATLSIGRFLGFLFPNRILYDASCCTFVVQCC